MRNVILNGRGHLGRAASTFLEKTDKASRRSFALPSIESSSLADYKDKMQPFESQMLSGWGRFPTEKACVFHPADESGINQILHSGSQPSYLARGLGRSYGDAALNSEKGILSFDRVKRFISFDLKTGVLECEAGVSFAEIIERFLPQGYFLPVTPGTKFVTVGGAIANDIHGKNHHRDGSFSNFVSSLTLLTAQRELLTCSPTNNEQVFWATIGGIGLTGMILKAQIKLQRVESSYVVVDYDRARNIDEALEKFSSAEDENYQYSVAWIDCLSRGSNLGRSVLMRGNHAQTNDLPTSCQNPLRLLTKPQWSLYFDLPDFFLNYFSVKTFNAMFYHAHQATISQLVSFNKFFYPLDAIHDWNRLYGRRGFVQYQVVFPLETSRVALVELLEKLSQTKRASFLAVLKRFGDGGQGLLSFPRKGFTLALDIAMSNDLPVFLSELDRLTLEHGGRIYLAKDAVMKPDIFSDMYPTLNQFKEIKQCLDPSSRISSSMARRLKISL